VFLVVQFPFADSRGFIEQGSGRLSRPAWPIADPGKDFVRSSGLVRPRLLGGVENWAGEDLYGDAGAALKFPDHLRKRVIATNGDRGFLRCAFRRFHSDSTVAHLDVGLKLQFEAESATHAVDVITVLRQVTQLEVSVAAGNEARKPVRLIEAGEALAAHFLGATTDRKQAPAGGMKPWWFSPGLPAVILEHAGPMALPPHTRRVLDLEGAGAALSHAWLQFGKQRCSAWIIAKNGGDPDASRRLRIHLVRLHAERECLKCILVNLRDANRLAPRKNTPACDAVQLYLRDALKLLQKPERYGLDQAAMLGAAQQAFGIAFEGETASLESMRRQVAARVDDYIRRAQNTSTVINIVQGDLVSTTIQMGNVSVTGDFNVVTARNIENSFNKAANAAVSDELKEKLKLLNQEVAKLTAKLPEEAREQVTKDLETLTSEAVSKKPRKAWYELSGEGLIDAAKTVAEMAAPVTTAVKAVLALLAL
jgi:hypothetical protein